MSLEAARRGFDVVEERQSDAASPQAVGCVFTTDFLYYLLRLGNLVVSKFCECRIVLHQERLWRRGVSVAGADADRPRVMVACKIRPSPAVWHSRDVKCGSE
jgi:hypothetical protein